MECPGRPELTAADKPGIETKQNETNRMGLFPQLVSSHSQSVMVWSGRRRIECNRVRGTSVIESEDFLCPGYQAQRIAHPRHALVFLDERAGAVGGVDR